MSDAKKAIGKLQAAAFVLGLIGVGGSYLCFQRDATQFYHAYLVAFLFWVSIPAGSLALLMIHHVAGGHWGHMVRRIFEASCKTLPLMALFFVPIYYGMHELFEWSHTDAVAHDSILQAKSLYLNERAFLERTGIYFILWIGMSWLLTYWSARQDKTAEAMLNHRMRVLSGIGIVIYALCATFASFDWIMSLEPHWFSSMMGPLFIVSQFLTALTFTIMVLAMLSKYEPILSAARPKAFHDIGNMAFACVICWTYMSFAQYIIIWSGNLPEEITWYLDRSSSGWKLVAVALALFHFAVPFFILLSRLTKLRIRVLCKVAAGIFLVRFVDLYWQTAPTLQTHEGAGSIPENIAMVAIIALGMGGVWVTYFATRLKGLPLLAQHDPKFEQSEASDHA